MPLDIGHASRKDSCVLTRVVAVANQKGGVGKTTTSVNLAACIAEQGIPTLLLDLDSQANATSGLGLEKLEGGSVYRPLLGDGTLETRIKPTGVQRLFLLPSELDLCAVPFGRRDLR